MQAKLQQPLLAQVGSEQSLVVNFDPLLEKLLREVKYLIPMGMNIPDVAMQIHHKADTFRTQISSLEMIVTKYNELSFFFDG